VRDRHVSVAVAYSVRSTCEGQRLARQQPPGRPQHRHLAEQPQHERPQHGKRKRHARQFAPRHQPEIHPHRQRHAQQDAGADDQEVLGLEIRKNVAPRGAQRSAHADLPASPGIVDPGCEHAADLVGIGSLTATRSCIAQRTRGYAEAHQRDDKRGHGPAAPATAQGPVQVIT
jgi:hypothetical protein